MEIKYKHMLVDPFLARFKQLLEEQNTDSDNIAALLAEKEKLLTQSNYLGVAQLVIRLTSYCTLRCKYCFEGNPYLKTRSHVPLETAVNSINLLLSTLDEVLVLSLTGGDVFLYPYLKEILKILIDKEAISQIQLVTPGIVQPDKELLALMKNDKIQTRVTVYGSKLLEVTRFITTLEQLNINFRVYEYGLWHDFQGLPKYGLSAERMQTAYMNCESSKYCKMLLPSKKGGILTPCSVAAALINLERFTSNELETLRLEDYKDPFALKDAIRRFFLLDYTKACDYCAFAIDNPRLVERGEQLEGGLPQSGYTLVKRDYLSSRIGSLTSAWTENKRLREENIRLQKQLDDYRMK